MPEAPAVTPRDDGLTSRPVDTQQEESEVEPFEMRLDDSGSVAATALADPIAVRRSQLDRNIADVTTQLDKVNAELATMQASQARRDRNNNIAMGLGAIAAVGIAMTGVGIVVVIAAVAVAGAALMLFGGKSEAQMHKAHERSELMSKLNGLEEKLHALEDRDMHRKLAPAAGAPASAAATGVIAPTDTVPAGSQVTDDMPSVHTPYHWPGTRGGQTGRKELERAHEQSEFEPSAEVRLPADSPQRRRSSVISTTSAANTPRRPPADDC